MFSIETTNYIIFQMLCSLLTLAVLNYARFVGMSLNGMIE